MGTVTHLGNARRVRSKMSGQIVTCNQCGERHPFIKLTNGRVECVTAFNADGRWFCRNRGCRAAWLAHRAPQGN